MVKTNIIQVLITFTFSFLLSSGIFYITLQNNNHVTTRERQENPPQTIRENDEVTTPKKPDLPKTVLKEEPNTVDKKPNLHAGARGPFEGQLSTEDIKSFTGSFWQHVNYTYTESRGPYYLESVYAHRFYYDDRPKWNGFKKVITFVSSARLGDANMLCLLWSKKENDKYSITIVPASFHSLRHATYIFRGLEYEPYHLSCDTTFQPDYVSLTYDFPASGKVIQKKDLQNLFEIEIPKKPATPANVSKTIGLCTHGLHGYVIDDAIPIFVQWIELNLMFGISKITMYNTTVIKYTDYFTKVIDYYTKKNVLEFSQFPTLPPIKPPYKDWAEVEMAQQTVVRHSLMDCYYKNLYNYWYILHLDRDEVVFPHGCKNYSDCLTKKLNENKDLVHAPCFDMENRYHFYNNTQYEEKNVSRNFPVLKYPTYTEDGWGYLRKAFNNPLYCDYLYQHGCWTKPNVHVQKELMMIHHFRFTCQKDHSCDKPNPKIIKENFLDTYKDDITKKTTETLKAINFSKNDAV